MSDDRLIDEFVKTTGASQTVARTCLNQTGWDLKRALDLHARVWSVQSRKSPGTSSRSNVATFRDLAEREQSNPEFFNGGEKSGLAVTNPNDRLGQGGSAGPSRASNLVDELIDKARQGTNNPNDPPKPNFFSRGGARLGTEDDEVVPSSSSFTEGSGTEGSSEPHEEELLHRTMFFWRDGFSVDDGPLYRFDDPQNQEYLRAMSMGRAPIELLGVEPHQLVDVHVVQRREEDYVKPKVAPSLNNSGSGQRLGSTTTTTTVEPSVESTSSESVNSSVLGSEGNAAVQIRLADGTAHRLRFDADGPVQQLYDYVQELSSKPFILQLPMPPQTLDDKQKSLKDAGVVGAVVVQRYQ